MICAKDALWFIRPPDSKVWQKTLCKLNLFAPYTLLNKPIRELLSSVWSYPKWVVILVFWSQLISINGKETPSREQKENIKYHTTKQKKQKHLFEVWWHVSRSESATKTTKRSVWGHIANHQKSLSPDSTYFRKANVTKYSWMLALGVGNVIFTFRYNIAYSMAAPTPEYLVCSNQTRSSKQYNSKW